MRPDGGGEKEERWVENALVVLRDRRSSANEGPNLGRRARWKFRAHAMTTFQRIVQTPAGTLQKQLPTVANACARWRALLAATFLRVSR